MCLQEENAEESQRMIACLLKVTIISLLFSLDKAHSHWCKLPATVVTLIMIAWFIVLSPEQCLLSRVSYR